MMLYMCRSTKVAFPSLSPQHVQRLVLLGPGSLHALVLSRQDCRAVVDAAEGLGDDGRAVRTNGGADGHEEAVASSQR